MIDDKKLMDKLKDWIRTDYFEDWSAKNFILSDVIEEINKMPKVGEWIPISERLPENFTSVLLTAKMPEDVECLVYTGGRAGTDFTLDGVINSERYEVIAWMPLPEPYKEEAQNDEIQKETSRD